MHHDRSLRTAATLLLGALLTVDGAGSRAQQAAPTPPATGAGEAAPLAYTVSPSDPRLRYEGRFDLRNYPRAAIYCATSPMMAGNPSAVAKSYLTQIVADENAAGDRNVRLLVFETQDGGKNGFGAEWHPSVKTDALMAAKLAATLRADLDWTPTTAKRSEKKYVTP